MGPTVDDTFAIVVGAGVAGLRAAQALKGAGFKVLVIAPKTRVS